MKPLVTWDNTLCVWETFFVCFPLVKFFINAVVCILCGLELRTVFASTSGFVRATLGTTFHLFILSLQAPMYDPEEHKKLGDFLFAEKKGSKPLSALMYGKNPNQLYPQEHFVKDPMPNTSNQSETIGINFIDFSHMGNVLANFNASAHENVPSTCLKF